MANGYKAQKPADPVLDGCSFVSWCTADGTAYDFEKIVTESTTVYAKWTNGAGITYLASEYVEEAAGNDVDVLVIIICAILALLAIVGSVLIIRGGVKRDKNTQ